MKLAIVVLLSVLLLMSACGSIPTQADGSPAPLKHEHADSGLNPATVVIIIGLGLLVGYTASGG